MVTVHTESDEIVTRLAGLIDVVQDAESAHVVCYALSNDVHVFGRRTSVQLWLGCGHRSTIERDACVTPKHMDVVTSTWPVCSNPSAKLASGLLLFFDGGDTILLGKEFRERYGASFWMEFGGNREEGESPAETARREATEETAEVLNIPLERVLESERRGWFVDYYNGKTNYFYRMYCVLLDVKPDVSEFARCAVGKDHVEKAEWRYFGTRDVVYSEDGCLSGTGDKLYSTLCVRLAMLRESEFLSQII